MQPFEAPGFAEPGDFRYCRERCCWGTGPVVVYSVIELVPLTLVAFALVGVRSSTALDVQRHGLEQVLDFACCPEGISGWCLYGRDAVWNSEGLSDQRSSFGARLMAEFELVTCMTLVLGL